MKKNKDNFYLQIQKFFDEDLMYKVFETDDICVCNVSDRFYAVFDYREIDGIQFGYIGGSKMAKLVANSPENIHKYILACEESRLKERLFVICEDTLKQVRKFKQLSIKNGASSCIDHGLEEELMNLSYDRRNKK